MEKRRRGRPKNDPAENVSKQVTVRLTTSEHELFERVAKRAGLKLAKWMRNRLTKAAKREAQRETRGENVSLTDSAQTDP
jgi:predicted HicB family RNase H-like nuclease